MHYIMTTVLGFVCLLSLMGFSQSNNVSLRIEPRYLQVNPRITTEARVLCVLQDSSGRKMNLAGCQFALYKTNHIWEFAKGPSSPLSSIGRWSGRYHGNGLDNGDCGIQLNGFRDEDRLIVGCRVRSTEVGSTWNYKTMMVYAETYEPMQFHLQPQVTIATAGSDVTFNGVAEHELTWCYFWLLSSNNTVELDFDAGHNSAKYHNAYKNSLARYHGDGLEQKQCGVTMLNVQPERSGFVTGRVQSYVTSTTRASVDFVQLIVLTAPEAPLLTVNTTGQLAPGQVLHATCVVKNSRPVANLTWFLGDEVIREDNINEAPLDSKWRWEHDLQTIEQHLEHVVNACDNYKKLKCKASHVALASGSEDSTSHVIRVGASANPCQPNPCGANSECRVVGDVAACSCLEHFVGRPPSCQPE